MRKRKWGGRDWVWRDSFFRKKTLSRKRKEPSNEKKRAGKKKGWSAEIGPEGKLFRPKKVLGSVNQEMGNEGKRESNGHDVTQGTDI